MRILTTLAALAFVFVVASPALAQTAVGFGGVNPAAIVSQPITTGSSTGSIATIPLFDHSIHLKDYFSSVGSFSNQPVIGQSTYPTAENMPGLNYLKAFGFSQSQVQPPPTSSSAKKKKRFPAWLYSRPYTSN